MTNPEIIEEKTLSLVDVKKAVKAIEKRDTELGLLSQKTKEYMDASINISNKDQEVLRKGLGGLKLARLKPEYINKIIDFLPKDVEELKIVLQAYPLTLPKKDQQAIVDEVKKIL
jgi:DNA-directed RNA polymerase subunit F